MPQDPSNPHTVSGLIRKRAEIAGQIEHAQAALRRRRYGRLERVSAHFRSWPRQYAFKF